VPLFAVVCYAQSHGAKTLVLEKNEGEKRLRRPLGSLPIPSEEFILKVTPQNSGSQHFVLGTEEIPPGGEIPRHKHLEQDEILLIQTGTAHVTLNDKEYDVHAGGMVFFPAQTTSASYSFSPRQDSKTTCGVDQYRPVSLPRRLPPRNSKIALIKVMLSLRHLHRQQRNSVPAEIISCEEIRARAFLSCAVFFAATTTTVLPLSVMSRVRNGKVCVAELRLVQGNVPQAASGRLAAAITVSRPPAFWPPAARYPAPKLPFAARFSQYGSAAQNI
jgi:quercetin dioxygenase-like cupin family protein